MYCELRSDLDRFRWRSALHSKFLWHSLKYYALNTTGDSISSDMFIFFLSSAVTRDLEVKQSKILDLLQTIRHQRLDKIVKLCGVPENRLVNWSLRSFLRTNAKTASTHVISKPNCVPKHARRSSKTVLIKWPMFREIYVRARYHAKQF